MFCFSFYFGAMHVRTWALFIARRYLAPARRNRFIGFITLIATLGVMFGTTALLVSLSILDGFDKTLRSNMISFMGHIEVTSIKQGRPLSGYREVVASLPKFEPQVTNVSPFVRREGIIRSRTGLEGVLVKGIDAATDLSTIRQRIVAGTFDLPEPAPGGLPTVVIGERLGIKLKLRPGDTAVIFAPNGTPSPENPAGIEQFVVGGLYRTGMAEHDDIYTYTSLRTAQRLWKYQDDQITGYDILIRDVDSVAQASQRISVALGYPHFAQTFYDIFAPFFAWLDLQRVPIPIVLTLISIVAVFNIVSTLLIMILEKTESIGVLTTLGAGPGGVMSVFVGQGLLIGGIGTALGCLISLAFTLAQQHFQFLRLDADIYFIDAVPVSLNPWHYLIVISVSVVLCVLSTLFPAYVASRLRPVDALRFQ